MIHYCSGVSANLLNDNVSGADTCGGVEGGGEAVLVEGLERCVIKEAAEHL